jgi:hypothetical protein
MRSATLAWPCAEWLEPRRLLATLIGKNWEGTDRSAAGGAFPPDTMGAVGPNHVAEITNGRWRAWDKDGTQLEDQPLNNFWIDAGVNPVNTAFDPRLMYDQLSARWFAVSVDNQRQDNAFLVAVSASSNPTGAWTGFRIDSDAGSGNRWADFPQLGIDSDGLYITANMMDIAGGPALGGEVNLLVLPKADLIAGSIANRTLLEDVQSMINFTAQGVVYPEANSLPAFFFSIDSNTDLVVARVDGPINNPSAAFETIIDLPNSTTPPNMSQPNGTSDLETGGRVIRGTVWFEQSDYWLVQSITGPTFGNSAIRFVRVDGLFNVVQVRVLEHATMDYSYPSLAVNDSGDVAIGFSASGPNAGQFPSAYAYLGTTVGNVTTFGSPILLRLGETNYNIYDSANRNRWGDYSATVPDPVETDNFWTFQEFVTGMNNWGTQITQLAPTGIQPPANLPKTLMTVEGYITPFGPGGTSPDVQSANAMINSVGDIDSYFIATDGSIGSTFDIRVGDVGDPLLNPAVAIYDAFDGSLLAFNRNDFPNDDARLNFDPADFHRYIIAVADESGAGGTGELTIDVDYGGSNPGLNIALDELGDGARNDAIGSGGADPDFFRFTTPANTFNSGSVTLTPAAAFNADLWVFDSLGEVIGFSIITGNGAVENVNLTGLTPSTEYYITVVADNYSGDDTYELAVNILTPPPPPSQPDLTAASDLGVSNTDNITRDATPTFTGTSLPSVNIFLYADGVFVGSAASNAAGNWSITSDPLPDGAYRFTARASFGILPQSDPSPLLAVRIDTTAPTSTSSAFVFETQHVVQVGFNESVSAQAADLSLTNVTLGVVVLPAGLAVLNDLTSTIGWRYIGNASGIPNVLPDGNYTASEAAGAVTDVAGNPSANSVALDFFFLNGDADHDRDVDVNDLGILASNWQQSPRTFSLGDFDYSGTVDVNDLGVLASHWQQTLAPLGAPLGPALRNAAGRGTRLIEGMGL